jgi:hypothetical protein
MDAQMKLRDIALLLVFAGLTSGCSINHYVAQDYDQYLINNEGRNNLPATGLIASYSLTDSTESHRIEFRSATVGYANLWIVEFGDILESTLRSRDVQAAFEELTKEMPGAAGGDLHLVFELIKYEFADYGARVDMRITLLDQDRQVFVREYGANGPTQAGKMWGAGVFGMKNAIQQSTKLAMDDILRTALADLNAYARSGMGGP